MHVRKRIANVADSPPNKNAALTKPIPDSPEPWTQEEPDVFDDDVDDIVWNYLTVAKGKLLRDMIREEIAENWVDVSKAKVKEMVGVYELGCFKRWPRYRSNSIIDASWVTTWKMIGGNVGDICRLTVRDFKDQFQDLDAYVGTTGRSGQRLVNAVSVENPELILFGFDVSQAFAKGFAFE